MLLMQAASLRGPWRSNDRRSSGSNSLGSVVRRKSFRISTKRAGSSTWE